MFNELCDLGSDLMNVTFTYLMSTIFIVFYNIPLIFVTILIRYHQTNDKILVGVNIRG